jgi:predicted RNA-binding Zn ribbon-like protein
MANNESDTDWKDGFLFIGNHPALDFLNTRPVLNDEPVELLPDFTALLRWFRAAGLLEARKVADLRRKWGESVPVRRAVEAARDLRERLRKEIMNYESGGAAHRSTIEELNRLMADHPMHTRLKAGGGALSTESYCDPREPEDLLAPLAHSAAALLADLDRSRIRKCKHCVLHFYDTSKKGTRRWCSMQLCGNRAKVAAYAARRRSLSPRTPGQ